jgi:hypothetical protein
MATIGPPDAALGVCGRRPALPGGDRKKRKKGVRAVAVNLALRPDKPGGGVSHPT